MTWKVSGRRISSRFAPEVNIPAGSRLSPHPIWRSGEIVSEILKTNFNGGQKMTVQITPLHDRVLVRRLEEKETAKGGIIIPDTAKEKPQEGEVIAVGAGKIEKGQRVPVDVKAGDRILFGKYTGNDITMDGQEYLILREEEILAKLSGIAKAASGKK
jgi:chaperonin GroES